MKISAEDVDGLYHKVWHRMYYTGVRENSRNGPVMTIQEPVMLEIRNPRARVLHNPARDCNPFFHIAEVVWMLAGSNDVRFIEQFNKGYRNYADDDTNTVHGAYGHRWIRHWSHGVFSTDQIELAADRLRANPEDRQVVLNMWSPPDDLPPVKHNDRPCNTQIMFRVTNQRLDMLVINRSNDLVWGALGANVVHFTYLQELISCMTGIPLGVYRVISNNMHVYPSMPRYAQIRGGALFERWAWQYYLPVPILAQGEDWDTLYLDCRLAISGREPSGYNTNWMQHVAGPMMDAYRHKEDREYYISKVHDENWRRAAEQWVERRAK